MEKQEGQIKTFRKQEKFYTMEKADESMDIEDLAVSNEIIKRIMEYMQKGAAYIDDSGRLKLYNKKILEIFEINTSDTLNEILKRLMDYIYSLNVLPIREEMEQKEAEIKVHNKNKSYLISAVKLTKGALIIIEDRDSTLKFNMALGDSRAYYQFSDIIGESENIKSVKLLAQRVANSSSAVLLYGESGTGKELFAQSLHNVSLRRNNPFIAINCGAIPSELIESELFGYESGAFTGALKGGKIGKLEAASEGTLFLDEVENMPLNVQIKLLRALADNKIVRIGGVKEVSTDIRIISATKKDLLEEIDEGNFREDLYYRINVVTIKLPPLRERGNDIRLLAEHFINVYAKQFCLSKIKVDDELYKALSYYYWRGNVRELKNVIERTLLLADNVDVLGVDNLPEKVISAYKFKQLKNKMQQELIDSKENNLIKIAEEIAIRVALEQEKGNLSKTSKKLGIARSTLYQKIKENAKLASVVNSYIK